MTPLLFFWALHFARAEEPAAAASPEPAAIETPAREPEKPRDRFLFPILYYTPETSAAGGAMLIQNFGPPREGRTSHVISVVSLTVKGQYFVNFSPKYYPRDGIEEVSGSISYRYYPSVFYGRGVDGALRQGEPFTERTVDLNGQYLWDFSSQWALRMGAFAEKRQILDFETGGRMAGEIASVGDSYETTTGLVGLERDERDYPQAPKRGSLFRLGFAKSNPRDTSGARDLPDYTRTEFDWRAYMPWSDRVVIAGQVLLSEVEGELIPFSALNSVGGGARLRGFYAGRYRDKALALLQAEARWEWKDRFVVTAGAGGGRLASRAHEIGEARNLFAGTIGVHYVVDPRNRTKIRADLGFAEKSGFYLLIGEAF